MCPRKNGLDAKLRSEVLVRLRENGFFGGGLAAVDAFAGAPGLLERNAAHGGFGLFLDVGFAVRIAAPP